MTGLQFHDASGPGGMLIHAIGDIHGRLDLLEAMLARIDRDIAAHGGDWRIVLLGDYVDRGPHSKGVLDLIDRRRRDDVRVIALRGNHDAGFLEFLERPEANGLFAQYGGRETAESYGVKTDMGSDSSARIARDALLNAMPPAHIELLNTLDASATLGDFFFCHAGIRPGVPLDSQDPEDLMWIRREFLDYTLPHPKIIVHGHTPVSMPDLRGNRVNVDTRAYESGRLSALSICGKVKKLVGVSGAEISARR